MNKLTPEAELRELIWRNIVKKYDCVYEKPSFVDVIYEALTSPELLKAQGLYTRDDIEASNAALKETSEMWQHQKDRADALQQHAEKLAEALEELIQLKDWKDECGKDEHYTKFQPIAWENARAVLTEYKKCKT